jgi:hypothetical protein
MTKIEKQKVDFVNSIDLSQWEQSPKSETHYYQLSSDFVKYHQMMMDYKTINNEEFTKKYWLVVYAGRPDLLSVNKEIINNQKAIFSIDWGSCALKILDQIVWRIQLKLQDLERSRKY